MGRLRASSVLFLTAGVATLGGVLVASWAILQPIWQFQFEFTAQMNTGVRLAIVGVTMLAAIWLMDSFEARRALTMLGKGLCIAALLLPSLCLFVPLEVTVLFLEPVLLCCGVAVIASRLKLRRLSAVSESLVFVPTSAFLATFLLALFVSSAAHTREALGLVAGGGALVGFGAAELHLEKLLTEIRSP